MLHIQRILRGLDLSSVTPLAGRWGRNPCVRSFHPLYRLDALSSSLPRADRALVRAVWALALPLAMGPLFDSRPVAAQEIVVEVVEKELRAAPSQSPASSRIDLIDSQEQGRRHLDEELQFSPNVNFSGGNSRPRFFQIRGIGELEQFIGAPNPAVSFTSDGLELSNLGSFGTLFDLGTVRIDRGPQGFTGGASSLAGRIQLDSVEPAIEPAGVAQVTGGTDSLLGAGVAYGGAVPGTENRLSFRLSVQRTREDGFMHNVFLHRHDTNQRDEIGVRLGLKYEFSPRSSLDVRLLHLDNDGGYDAFTIDNTRTVRSDRPGDDRQSLDGVSTRLTIGLSDYVDLVQRFGISQVSQNYSYDGDWGNNPFWGEFAPYDYFSRTDRSRHTVTEELALVSPATWDRFQRSTYRAGFFFERLRENAFQEDDSSGVAYNALESRFQDRRNAGYLHLTTPIFEETVLTLGTRLERQAFGYRDSLLTAEQKDHLKMLGLAGVEHRLSKSVTLVTSVSSGFRGGGVNPGAQVPTSNRIYNPESLSNVEAGVRFSLFDARWRGTTNFFAQKIRSQQIQTSVQNNPSDPLSYTYLIDNASTGSGFGLEHESTAQISERLSLRLSGSLLRARYKGYESALGFQPSRDLAHAPRWQFGVGARYQHSNSFFSRVDVGGKDAFYFGDNNNERTGAYALLGAACGYDDGTLSVVLWGKNILDRRYAVRGFFFGNEPPDFPNKSYIQRGDPAQVGVTVAYNF